VLEILRQNLPEGTVLIGNLKRRQGLLAQSILTNGLKSALLNYYQVVWALVSNMRPHGVSVCTHTQHEVETALAKYSNYTLRANGFYFWFSAII
jgi:hypothetical protein